MSTSLKLKNLACLMRLDKPIGILLLLWPTLWALWLASGGSPSMKNLIVFVLGVVIMRSAGCILNDIADRNFDGHVDRTKQRPLVKGTVTVREAVMLAVFLLGCAFLLVLFCGASTVKLAVVGAALALIYPYLKRYTQLPQFGLGLAFAWGVPMAFTAEGVHLNTTTWWLYLTCMLWPIIYDTQYAMVDRDDDIKIGVKSTAVLLAHYDRAFLLTSQTLFLAMLVGVGLLFSLTWIYYVSLIGVAVCFYHQDTLIQTRERQHYFQAFLNHQWVGLIIFFGISMSFLL